MSYFIGADLGTSALKLLLYKSGGEIVRTVTVSYGVSYPKDGWSEQNPADWWSAFKAGVDKLCRKDEKKDVVAIGVAGQMHGLVMLDKDDAVIRPAILWNDGRSSKETALLNENKRELLENTANIAFAGFTAPKILWVRENERESFDRCEKIMLPKDYLNYKLTGVHASDMSDASGLLLLDVKNRCYSEKMLEICGLKKCQLPRLFESYEKIGTLLPSVARELGLNAGVVVAAGAGDNAGAAIGTGTVGEGKCSISLGTSGTVFVASESFVCDFDKVLHYFCHADGKYHVMGCILSAASSNKWLCDNILCESDYLKLQAEIDEEGLGKNGVIFLPYLMGERSPINDTDASGVFIGLRPNTTRADMVQAVFEGVSYAIRENVDIIKNMGVNLKSATVTGGGAKSPLWLKILSSVLNLNLSVLENEEGPALGAAYLAAVASGEIDGIDKIVAPCVKKTVTPDKTLVSLYERGYQSYKKLYPALKGVFKELKN